MILHNIFDAVPTILDEEIIDDIIKTDALKIERIISKGHVSPTSGWYDQPDNEWVIVIKGKARILIKGEKEVTLIPGSYLHLPAHTKHKVTWTTPNSETVWLAIHY